MPNIYFVYILASRSLTLYTGVTNGLLNRVSQHHQGLIPGFAATYRIFRLVYFEKFNDVRAAIARERQIKGYRREKKIRLIEFKNPQWNDLAEDSFPPKPPMHTEAGRAQTPEANLKQVPR